MEPFQKLLDDALAQPAGIAALCTSREAADRLRQVLYVTRARVRQAGDNRYDKLSLSIAPHAADTLFIYHTDKLNGK